MLRFLLNWLERKFNPAEDLGVISREHMYNINAASRRNIWFDKKGQRWRLRDSL